MARPWDQSCVIMLAVWCGCCWVEVQREPTKKAYCRVHATALMLSMVKWKQNLPVRWESSAGHTEYGGDYKNPVQSSYPVFQRHWWAAETHGFSRLCLILVLLPFTDAHYLLRDLYTVFHSIFPIHWQCRCYFFIVQVRKLRVKEKK